MTSPLHDCFFSIILPVYNRGRLLKRSIESVLAQSCTSYECILIDNGSTDTTVDVCKTYSNNHHQFSYIHEPRRGVSFARNAGITQAKGMYCILLDSDNTFPSANTLQELKDAITSLPVSTAFFCGVQFDNQRQSYLTGIQGNCISLRDYLHHQCGELAPVVATEWLKKHPFPEQESVIAEQADLLWIPLIHSTRVRALSLPLIAYHTDAKDRVSQRAYQSEHAHELATYYQSLYHKHGEKIRDEAGTRIWLHLLLRMLLYSKLANQSPAPLHYLLPQALHGILSFLPQPLIRILLKTFKHLRYKQTQEARVPAP